MCGRLWPVVGESGSHMSMIRLAMGSAIITRPPGVGCHPKHTATYLYNRRTSAIIGAT